MIKRSLQPDKHL